MKFLNHWILLVTIAFLGCLGSQETQLSNTLKIQKTAFSTQNPPSHNTFDFVELEETEDDFQEQISPNLPSTEPKIIFGFAYLLLIFSAIRLGQYFDRNTPFYLAFENLRI
jgi:hypothetical protein